VLIELAHIEMELITLLAAKFAEEQGAFKLLIVDSILALFRVDFSGRGELSERQQKSVMLALVVERQLEGADVPSFAGSTRCSRASVAFRRSSTSPCPFSRPHCLFPLTDEPTPSASSRTKSNLTLERTPCLPEPTRNLSEVTSW
jgi:hypothetical protein